MTAADIEGLIVRALDAQGVRGQRHVQTLWSGYGAITRVELSGASVETVVVKHIRPPASGQHPRGWESEHSHERKLRSYEVERCFYRDYAPHLSSGCRVPKALYSAPLDDGWLLILEDLDGAGFPERRQVVSDPEIKACLTWLACLHAVFVGRAPVGLWEVGTYWHLATRPDELRAMSNQRLKSAASRIDERLNACRYQTLVHGDAKLANFCFSLDGTRVAAVDFQYAGAGAA